MKIKLLIIIFLISSVYLISANVEDLKNSMDEVSADDRDMDSNAIQDPFAREKERAARILKEQSVRYTGIWINESTGEEFFTIKWYLWSGLLWTEFLYNNARRYFTVQMVMGIQALECNDLSFEYDGIKYFLHLENEGRITVRNDMGESFAIIKK